MDRRSFLAGLAATPAAFILGADHIVGSAEATPSCGPRTPAQMEGPFFKPNSPLRRNLVPKGSTRRQITLWGVVRDTACKPVPGALVELWHADPKGAYDTIGFAFRGHQFTDEKGRYRFTTVYPGLYPGRTRHFHVKVQARGGPVLTSQLYFPGERLNPGDGLYDPRLLMTVTGAANARSGRFDFVIRT